MSQKPVCVKCQCYYRPEKIGFYYTEMKPKGSGGSAIRGVHALHAWEPYKCWAGDKWKCPDCKNEIIIGTPMFPFTEHYKPDFEFLRNQHKAEQLCVNDC